MSTIFQVLQVLSNERSQPLYELDIIIPFLCIREARVRQIKVPQNRDMLQWDLNPSVSDSKVFVLSSIVQSFYSFMSLHKCDTFVFYNFIH